MNGREMLLLDDLETAGAGTIRLSEVFVRHNIRHALRGSMERRPTGRLPRSILAAIQDRYKFLVGLGLDLQEKHNLQATGRGFTGSTVADECDGSPSPGSLCLPAVARYPRQ
jgi:hypothetical protein